MNFKLRVKKFVLEVLMELPPPYDDGYEKNIHQYYNEVCQELEKVKKMQDLSDVSDKPDHFYCVRCRARRFGKNIMKIVMKNKKIAYKAYCEVCNTTMFKIPSTNHPKEI